MSWPERLIKACMNSFLLFFEIVKSASKRGRTHLKPLKLIENVSTVSNLAPDSLTSDQPHTGFAGSRPCVHKPACQRSGRVPARTGLRDSALQARRVTRPHQPSGGQSPDQKSLRNGREIHRPWSDRGPFRRRGWGMVIASRLTKI